MKIVSWLFTAKLVKPILLVTGSAVLSFTILDPATKIPSLLGRKYISDDKYIHT